MSLVISLGDYLVKNRFVYRAKHIFFAQHVEAPSVRPFRVK